MSDQSPLPGIPRRTFLAYGSVCVASSFWLALPAGAATPQRIAIGYCPQASASTPRVVDARSLPSGDNVFARTGARISILELVAVTAREDSAVLEALAVDVHYPISGQDAPVLHRAWQFSNRPILHMSPGNSFTVPAGADTGLSLTLAIDTKSGHHSCITTRFTLGGEPGLPKLMPGIYFLAPTGRPSWRQIEWRAIEGGQPRLAHKSVAPDEKIALAGFPYLVMTVDYPQDVLKTLV
jgi:hypothetical protein